nr:MAG TPA: hypothetical protein [Caudoviricetes sp.]
MFICSANLLYMSLFSLTYVDFIVSSICYFINIVYIFHCYSIFLVIIYTITQEIIKSCSIALIFYSKINSPQALGSRSIIPISPRKNTV